MSFAFEVPDALVEWIEQRMIEIARAESQSPRWMTLEEAAGRYRTTAGALRWRAQHGRLPGVVKDEGRWLLDVRAFDEALMGNATVGSSDKRAPRCANSRRPGTGGTSSHAR
jgi:hypothetical protein